MNDLKEKLKNWLALGIIDLYEAFDLIAGQARLDAKNEELEELKRELNVHLKQ